MSARNWLFSLVAVAAPACGGSAGTAPHDMSAAQHEQQAREVEGGAATHSGQHDPEASAAKRNCNTSAPVYGSEGGRPICWTSVVNPTAAHREEAERYRELAARHRQASAELREAEERACTGIAPDDRDMSPFLHQEEIASVEPLVRRTTQGRATIEREAGSRVILRAVPGLTAEWLQRVVSCHVARNATLGHQTADLPHCPLVLRGVSARVTSTGNAFAVEISANDVATARDILARSRRLTGQSASK